MSRVLVESRSSWIKTPIRPGRPVRHRWSRQLIDQTFHPSVLALLAGVTGIPAAPVPAHRTTRNARPLRSDHDVTAAPVGRSPTILGLLKLLGS